VWLYRAEELIAALYWWLRGLCAPELYRVVHDLAARYGVDWHKLCEQQCMTWEKSRSWRRTRW
jgi:hypothetical protein